MRTFIVVSMLVLAVPAAAFAAKPSPPSHPATSAKGTVLWVLRGTLSKYTAASGSTAGSISITVKSASLDSGKLKGMTLTFATNAKTTVVLHNDKPIADGDRGIVKVRAAKSSDAAALQTHTAFAVIEQGASS